MTAIESDQFQLIIEDRAVSLRHIERYCTTPGVVRWDTRSIENAYYNQCLCGKKRPTDVLSILSLFGLDPRGDRI